PLAPSSAGVTEKFTSSEQSGSMVSVFSIPRGEVHEQEMLQEGQALQGMSAARKVSRNPARC
ncbi:MAG: hypothetical protein KF731_11865, partial [Thauera sp.]|nr:hypothetical protein [Thauera sp.]